MADERDGDDEPAAPSGDADARAEPDAPEGDGGDPDGGDEEPAPADDAADEPASTTIGDATGPDTSADDESESDAGDDPDTAPAGTAEDDEFDMEAESDLIVDNTEPSEPKNWQAEREERQQRIEQTQREREMLEADDEESWSLPEAGGPGTDQEMPLTAHVEEMLKRLAVVVAVAGLVSLLTFPFAEAVINVLWNSILPAGETTRPRLYGILELMFTKLKVASLAGVIVALPVLVYETYQFMRPGLYPHERRYYLAAIPTSLVLALVGVTFAYVIVLPAIFLYFTGYTEGVAGVGFALGRTFNLILLLMGYMALVFQIPLFLMLAMMMGLVTRRWLAERRLIFWGSFLGISFIFSPDPTGMAPILVAATMIALFEGTLLLTKWTGRGKRRRGSADV